MNTICDRWIERQMEEWRDQMIARIHASNLYISRNITMFYVNIYVLTSVQTKTRRQGPMHFKEVSLLSRSIHPQRSHSIAINVRPNRLNGIAKGNFAGIKQFSNQFKLSPGTGTPANSLLVDQAQNAVAMPANCND